MPSALMVLVFGILMVADGPWEFDQLWIVLGPTGFAITFLTGVLVLKPAADRLHALIERDHGMSPAALAHTERLLILSRTDIVVLYLVVAVMVIKPTGADTAVLGAMAAILVAAFAYVAIRARAVEIPGEAAVAGGGLSASGGEDLNLSSR